MNIVNQKPTALSPVYKDDITKDFDPVPIVSEIISHKLFSPVVAGQPVTIGNLSEDEITDLVLRTLGEFTDIPAETALKEIFGKTLISYDAAAHLNCIETFALQSGVAANLPEPDDNTIYTPASDVIPTMRQFLAGTGSYDAMFASLAYYARPSTLGFYFVNEIVFDQFISWAKTQHTALRGSLSAETNQMMTDFTSLKLTDLTEALILRSDASDGNEPFSFPRLIVNMLMQYTKQTGVNEFGVLPFDMRELVHPKTITFVNVEKHARATTKEVADEWKLISDALADKNRLIMISKTKLNRLTAVAKTAKHIAQKAAALAQSEKSQKGVNTFHCVPFSKNRPSVVDVGRHIIKVMENMTTARRTMNIFKQTKNSFAKPNRRDPDDYNKQGKLTSTKYKPDIHLYIDTSGSISEADYESTVRTCIALAKKMNINMYFNSFSHVLSPTSKLHIAGKSTAGIYAEFSRIKKVTGGTDYEQIWHFINMSRKRQRELSLIITDFEWTARSRYVKHPKNLFYIPCSTVNWKTITNCAKNFCDSMMANDSNIRRHLLF